MAVESVPLSEILIPSGTEPDLDHIRARNARSVWHPMAHPGFHQANPPRIITGAEGVYIEDDEGHRVIDAVGGIWNVNLGYSCTPIKQAIAQQLDVLPFYSAFKGTTSIRLIELADRLVGVLEPEGMRRAFFTSGGSDSVETALRLTRQFWKLAGQPGKVKFFSFKKGYHGTHFGGASVNGNDRFRKSYEPLLPGCIQLPFPSLYHNSFGIEDIDELTDVCLRQIEQEINYQGADSIAAFIAEPVLGAGGILVPPPSLWPALRALCDKYDILLIADEVVTGFGRTGSWFGSRAWGVKPDMMCFAKAITSGYFPFGALMLNERIETVFMESGPDGAIGHGYTYSGHPVGCAAALATLDVTFGQDLPGNALARGEQLMTSLKALQAEHEMIGDVRGKGLMVGIELVADRESKTPLDLQLGEALADRVFAAGAMIRVTGNIIIMSPPLVITESEIDSLTQALSVGFAGA